MEYYIRWSTIAKTARRDRKNYLSSFFSSSHCAPRLISPLSFRVFFSLSLLLSLLSFSISCALLVPSFSPFQLPSPLFFSLLLVLSFLITSSHHITSHHITSTENAGRVPFKYWYPHLRLLRRDPRSARRGSGRPVSIHLHRLPARLC
jgi:hypothetical protein